MCCSNCAGNPLPLGSRLWPWGARCPLGRQRSTWSASQVLYTQAAPPSEPVVPGSFTGWLLREIFEEGSSQPSPSLVPGVTG